LTNSGGTFEIPDRLDRLARLEQQMAGLGFWDDQDSAQRAIAESNTIKSWTEPWAAADSDVADLADLLEMLKESPDEEIENELARAIVRARSAVQDLELRNMLRGEDAHRSAIVTINPGAGGRESQDWAEMLMRMYTRWGERRGYRVSIMDVLHSEEAGIKSATLEIDGEFAYGYLSAERGVHRLVRISPFDSQGRRHTSFASVFVYPVVDEDITVDIQDEDLRIDTYRASGAGGQHVNKTDSAVRITHVPSGIVVSCQQERSQFKNRSKAMKMLQAALYQKAQEEREAERAVLEGSKEKIEWGSQIRSYVLQPYKMVKDHRTKLDVGNADAVLDGDIDPFIEAFLREEGTRARTGRGN